MYDLAVIGAGSAGAVVAARASENPDLRVLLLEAGPDYPLLAETPFDLWNGHDNSYEEHDWHNRYRPTEHARPQRFPRGRVTGGSSAVNTAIALRGMPEDYDAWAAAGLEEWSWERVLPAFCRLERDLDFGDAPWHGDAGPISIRRSREDELTVPQHAFLEASRALGYPECPDANDPASQGAGPHPMNKLGRTRISTAVGYLAPARVRPNLDIRALSSVQRLVIRNGRVDAAVVERSGALEHVRARVFVLCAGAIETPCILMRSGVGPGAELDALGIEQAADVAGVGANLCDHPALAVLCAAKDPAICARDLPIIQTILRYTAPGSEHRNDLQIEQLTFAARTEQHATFAIAAVLEQCESRGRLRLSSSDPAARPHIEPGLCSDERDVSRLAVCFKDTLAFAQTKPVADLIERVLFPDPARALDDAAIAELCRRLSASGYHPCGTAKMGTQRDPTAVVDQYGCAHSLANLVVADASILPAVPRANTNLTCIMVGERVGEWIRTRPSLYGL